MEKVKQKAAPATLAGHPPTAKRQKMDFGSGANPKPMRWEELKRLVGWFVEETLPLNTIDLPTFHDIVTQFSSR